MQAHGLLLRCLESMTHSTANLLADILEDFDFLAVLVPGVLAGLPVGTDMTANCADGRA